MTLLPPANRARSVAIFALPLLILLWPLHHLAERYYSEQLAEQNQQTLDLYVGNLLGTLRRYEDLPPILSELPALRATLRQTEDLETRDTANARLAEIRQRTGADVIYLMRPDGLTQAASNWDQPDSFVGRNFAFRPYYKDAIQGKPARFFGLGTTSNRRGYYFASEVRDPDRLLGVLVVKLDLDGFGAYNEANGLTLGDVVLKQVADLLRAH